MRGLIFLISLLFSFSVFANIEQRIAIFSQQTDLFRQICFLPDGTFLTDRILFDQRGSIEETGFDCNAQALALEEEHRAIEAFVNSGECPANQTVADQGLINLLEGSSPVVEELTCPGIRSATDCMNNLSCNLMKSIFPVGLAAARYVSNHPVFSSCDGTASCFSNIGKAIWDNLWDTVKGLYNLGSMVVGWAGDAIGSLWASEDATSSRGIAATEATDSQLDRFLADPISYLYEMGQNFMTAISDGIKSRYGCAAWSGLPHISECTQPMSWECADCNEKLNMACGIAGYIAGNFVTNFFTGGAAAAARLTASVAATTTFRIASSVPGAAALMERMAVAGARAGRLGRVGSVIGGTIRAAWTGITASRPVQGTLSVARTLIARGRVVNEYARKKVFLYAPGQDLVINAARGYHRLTLAATSAGYRTTYAAAQETQRYLMGQFPRLADITAGRYARVSTPEQYLREATKNMAAEDRRYMQVTVTTDARGERRVVVSDTRAGALESDIRFNFTPQTAPAASTTVARSVASTAEVPVVDEIVVTASRRTPPTPEQFIERWADRTATTQRQNRDFIQTALRGEQPGLFYLDTQNTALKRLNDTLRNKQLVDAFGNRYNDIVMEALEEFKSAHPGVTVSLYSDYKSLRAAIQGPAGQEQALMEALAQAMNRADDKFLTEVRASGLVELGEDERWFRSGLGRTADEANLVTRFSRRAADGTPVTFNNIGAQTRIRDAWQVTEQTRRELARRFGGTTMMRQVDDISIPTADVLEVVRKNSDPDAVARILSGRYNRTITRQDAELLKSYFDRVDQFSPGLLIPTRVEHRFDQAVHGGFSVDFAGVGSVNAEATALGLAQGRTVRDSLGRIRSQEGLVTAELDALKARTERAIRTTLSRHGIYADITVSGDDMLVVPSRALTPEIRREVAAAQVAAQRGTPTAASGMRTSFFPEGISDQASRSVQATIGESIEKKLRSRLEGRLSRDELRNTMFAVEMRGTTVGAGGVGLETVNPALSPASRRIIEDELRGAIEDVNKELRSNGQGGSLMREGSFLERKLPEFRMFLLPGDEDRILSPAGRFGLLKCGNVEHASHT